MNEAHSSSMCSTLAPPAVSSAAAELAAALPSARVLKAFNTTFAATLGANAVGPNQTTVLIAGDDAEAKAALVSVITAGGVDAIDAGSLSRAHELEAMGCTCLGEGDSCS